jgi:hypothetical protein
MPCKPSLLTEALHWEFDASCCSTSRISSMRQGYSPFTHRTFVSRPSGGCQTSTIRMLADFQRYRAATSVAPGSNGRRLAGSWSVTHAGGLGPRSEGPHGAFRSRSRTDCRLKGFHSARSHSPSHDCRCSVRTASSWSTLRGALHLIVVWPARWVSADAHSCFGPARFGVVGPTRATMIRRRFSFRGGVHATRIRVAYHSQVVRIG